jgi:hypothetical protein
MALIIGSGRAKETAGGLLLEGAQPTLAGI